MTLDVMLFFLRVVAGITLMSLMLAFFVVIWLEYRLIERAALQTKRVHGQLRSMRVVDGRFVEMSKAYPLHTITTLGRAVTNTIVLDNHFASGEHAAVTLRDGQWWLEDRGSRNGTLLNQERIMVPTIITEGDVLSIGESHFKVILSNQQGFHQG